MAASPDEFAALRLRVDRLETGLAQTREQAQTAQTLARLNDRDIADLKASQGAILRSIQALHETQVEQGQVLADHSRILADHSRTLADHSRILADHTEQLTEIRAGLGVVREGVVRIIGLLDDKIG